jgi:hypothetical protein
LRSINALETYECWATRQLLLLHSTLHLQVFANTFLSMAACQFGSPDLITSLSGVAAAPTFAFSAANANYLGIAGSFTGSKTSIEWMSFQKLTVSRQRCGLLVSHSVRWPASYIHLRNHAHHCQHWRNYNMLYPCASLDWPSRRCLYHILWLRVP